MSDKTDLWDIQVHIQMIAINIQMDPTCVTDATMMVTQYAKRCHIKYKGVMATNEQGGSMLNNRS